MRIRAAGGTPRHHHYVPQFYLRNFAVDPEGRKITTVAKHGAVAVWARRSIESLGFERDLYLDSRNGVPFLYETRINRHIETPLSRSDTWMKIQTGRTDALDRSDKAILYALIRHFEARTPHYFATNLELAKMAADPAGGMSFSEEELEHYALIRDNPGSARTIFNMMASSVEWSSEGFAGCGVSILRSPIPVRTSTVPVMALPAPSHPALHLPLPGMVPYQLVIALNPSTIASLVMGDFDDGFSNAEIGADVALAFNRYYVGHFAKFEHVRHLITGREALDVDMTWAPYELQRDDGHKITYRRRS